MDTISQEKSSYAARRPVGRATPLNPPVQPVQMGWGTAVSSVPRCRWEYLIVRAAAHGQAEEPRVTGVTGDAQIERGILIWPALESLGLAEWELAAVQALPAGWIYIFKRPLAGGS